MSATRGIQQRARLLQLRGRVQGVGFRPYVFRLAQRFALAGWVVNRRGTVSVHVQGEDGALDAFQQALLDEAPAPAQPLLQNICDAPLMDLTDFRIRASEAQDDADVHVPPDLAPCADCLAELRDSTNRRHGYPFVNCARCGPRYTLIRDLPYDRANTTMAAFDLCATCAREYHAPADRRFHAEPIACAICGPRLSFEQDGLRTDDHRDALAACVALLRVGGIVAVKGIGGYHLMCDAHDAEAIARLRARKHRLHKPFAVMFSDLGAATREALARDVHVDDAQFELLRSDARPIVLLQRAASCSLPDVIAPGLREIGVLLPYSPLHHLLLDAFGSPLVATSGNVSGEPVISDNAEARQRLASIADGFLHHDRPIARPADDSVYRHIAGRARPLRLGRGNAPLERTLPFTLETPLLAVGGHMKNSVALAWQDRVVVSPHIGELDGPRSLRVFAGLVTDLQDLYAVRAEHVVCDAHPRYASHRWARDCGLPVTTVFHHHAHAAALAGEYPEATRWLVFTWDGVGLGADGTLWGGEALLGAPGAWRRVASLRRFRLPGGERAAREPWRSAAALCWHTPTPIPCPRENMDALQHAWQHAVNSPHTSSAGRVFDAAASLLGLLDDASYEGQAAMLLETIAEQAESAGNDICTLSVVADDDGVLRGDWQALVPMLLDRARTKAARAACFHEALAQLILDQARAVCAQHGEFAVGLTGGVFQNKRLAERVHALLDRNGFRVYLPHALPMNDGGLCYGQIIEAAAALRMTSGAARGTAAPT